MIFKKLFIFISFCQIINVCSSDSDLKKNIEEFDSKAITEALHALSYLTRFPKDLSRIVAEYVPDPLIIKIVFLFSGYPTLPALHINIDRNLTIKDLENAVRKKLIEIHAREEFFKNSVIEVGMRADDEISTIRICTEWCEINLYPKDVGFTAVIKTTQKF